jgi:hypothetical protein
MLAATRPIASGHAPQMVARAVAPAILSSSPGPGNVRGMAALSRRTFMVRSCGLVCGIGCRQAFAQRHEFVCSTVDPKTAFDSDLEISRYSADAGIDPQVLELHVKDFKISPYGTIMFGHRWRRSEGLTPNTGLITLGVHFLNGSQNQKEAVRQVAPRWLSGELATKLKFEFDVTRPRAHITINFETNANNSIIGRQSAEYAAARETMNLAEVVDHVIVHEFGHAIGLQHEHRNPDTPIQWNKPVVIAEMGARGWSPEMCEKEIFTRLSQSYACVSSPAFDRESIMMYPIPSGWTTNNFSSDQNTSISAGDRSCLTGIYRI